MRPDAIYEAIETTLSLLDKLTRDLLPNDECMKAGYVDNAFMLYDDTRELNFTFAYDNHVLDRGYRSVSDRAATYDAVTPDDLCRAAERVFRPEGLVLVVKGNAGRIDREKILAEIRRLS